MKKTSKIIFLFLIVFFISSVKASINFIHIPRTGGTTLNAILGNQFKVSEIYFPWKNGVYIENLPIQHDYLGAHIPYSFIKKYDPNVASSFLFTVLREPVDRVLSESRRHGKNNTSNPLDDLAKNHMCLMLCSDLELTGEELLNDCIKTLERCDLVIFYDDFENGVKELIKAIGLNEHEIVIPNFNATKKVQVSEETIKKIRDSNDLDIRLYEYAKKNLSNKPVKKYSQVYSSLDCLKKLSTHMIYTFDLPLMGSGQNWGYRENVGTSDSVYRWIIGNEARLSFHLLPETDYLIIFKAHLLREDAFPKLSVNQVEVRVQKLTEDFFATYVATVPREILSNSEMEITFSCDGAIFNEIYPHTADSRWLSMALNLVEIFPVDRKKSPTCLFCY
jgi:hypothetical protein